MNKGAVSFVVALGIVGAGAGGFVYAENKVKMEIDVLFAQAADGPIIDSLTHDGVYVDLLGDVVTLTNVKAAVNMSQTMDAVGTLPSGMTITGSATQTYETTTVTGIWDLLLGGSTIATMDASNGTFAMNMVQTMETAPVTKTLGSTGTPKTVDKVVITSAMTGTMARLNARAVDISAYLHGNPSLAQQMIPVAAAYSADDIVFDLSMTASSDTQAQQMPPFKIKYTIARSFAEDISPDFIALAGARDITVTTASQAPEVPSMKMTVGEVSLSGTKLVDMIPVKTAYEIKDMVFDTSAVPSPQVAATMAMLGIDEFNMDMKLAYSADMDAHTFSLAPFELGLKKVGSVNLDLNITGLPSAAEIKALQDNIDTMDKAEVDRMLAGVSLKRVALGYQDQGVLKKFIAAQAMQLTGGDVGALAQGYAGQAAMLVNATHGPEKAQQVQATIAKFLADPNAIRIGLSTPEPIKFTDLVKDIAKNGPMALRAFQLYVTGG